LEINNKPQSEAQEKKEFALELTYENIKLIDQNIRLMLENYRLKEDLKELKRLDRWWKGENGQTIGKGFLN
jgi:hypothetical protein